MRENKFDKGKLVGENISYYPDGKVQVISHYKLLKDKKTGKKNSVPHGKWYYFEKTGQPSTIIEYKNGEKITSTNAIPIGKQKR